MLPDVSKIFGHLHHQAHSVEARNIILDCCERNVDARLLDCGCNDGKIATEVAQRIGTKDIWGIELVEEFAAKAIKKGVKVVRGDLNDPLPLETEIFDVVHAANIIEHVSNTDLFLKEVHRVLKVGGYFLVSTCNLAAFHNIFFLLLGRQPPPADVSDEFQVGVWTTNKRRNAGGPCHRRMFTLKALEGLLECHEFEVEKSIGSGFYPLPFPLARLLCKIDKRHSAYIIIKAKKANY